MKKLSFVSCAALALAVSILYADQPAPNIPYVKSGTWGRCYVKAIPAEYYGEKGITKLYLVKKDADELIHTYPWFSQSVYLQGNMVGPDGSGISVVRMGPWHDKIGPAPGDMALEFYFGPRLLKRYSTQDIAGKGSDYQRTRGHYSVIKEVKGYRWIDSNSYAFDIVTFGGRTISIDPATGKILK